MADAETVAAEQFYGILAFIPDGSDFTFEEAISRFRAAFPQHEVRSVAAGQDRAIEIAAKRWRMWAELVEQPHVAAESREMAEWLAEHPAADQIAGSKRRVEFSGTDIEPGSDCFGALCTTCEVLKTFSGIVVFDLEGRDLFC